MRAAFTFLLLSLAILGSAQDWKPTNGAKEKQDFYISFENASIFHQGKYLTNATLLIKGDQIKAVGEKNAVAVPQDAIRHNMKGKFIYPSFIEIYSDFGMPKVESKRSQKPQLESKKQGPYYYNECIRPENSALDQIQYDKKEAEKLRSMGFGIVSTIHKDGVIRGTSSLLALHDEADERVLEANSALHYSFFKGSSQQSYPTSLMGMIALIRQSWYDARWYEGHREETDFNASLEALLQHRELSQIIDAGNTLSALRAQKIADELELNFIIKGEGKEYERVKEFKQAGSRLILPLDFPKPYDVSDPLAAIRLPLAYMKAWELAPFNPRILEEEEINYVFTADGLKDAKSLFGNLRKAVEKGLDPNRAVEHFTIDVAAFLGVEDKYGSIEAGKLANFIVLDDSIFSKNAQLLSNWVMGKEHQIKAPEIIQIDGKYSLNVGRKMQFDLKVDKQKKGFKAQVSPKGENEYVAAQVERVANRVVINFVVDQVNYRLSGSISDSLSRIWSGKAIVDQEWTDWAAIRKARGELNTSEDSLSNDTVPTDSIDSQVPQIFYPNMAYGWDSIPQAEGIVFRNATVWTNEAEGIQKKHDVVIYDGKIKMVGYKINLDIMFPEIKDQLKEIDLSGKHLTSGIIDEHSHIAIDRGVNEAGEAVTAEVRIGDVIDSDDINIYRQLSGGVTASQLLHGSANPIGGQSALIKLRWGKSPEEMKIEGAAGFIKFALGENVKQSNWGDRNTVRFPQTRMGVEQVFYDAFHRADAYRDEQTLYNAKKPREKKNTLPPRRDLELEALSEILDTQRFITCHSYIQSEINMLMHVADSMKFRINTFTHILEGYKVANKLKEHGAAASTFSDWWAYKFEVNDAIPYNGAILHEQGVLTGFNSDDAEMGRRLNQEAAKAVKYGGVSQEEAWKFVTLNPAKMLHLDDRMGSIKAGKDADLVIWSDNPLSIYAKAEQTYIDGICYFDAERDQALRKRNIAERERLINLMLAEKQQGKPTQKIKAAKEKNYHCNDLEQ